MALPILDHNVEVFDDSIDFFEIFAASFLGLDIQRTTERDHIPQITNMTGRQLRIFGLFENSFPNLHQLVSTRVA